MATAHCCHATALFFADNAAGSSSPAFLDFVDDLASLVDFLRFLLSKVPSTVSIASVTPAHRKSIVQSDSRPTHKMSPSATSSPAVTAAAIFLTRPFLLLGFLPQRTVLSLQLFLCSALSSPSSTRSANSNSNSQVLSFTPTSLPPLPVQLACVAFGIKWAAWIQALGGAAFDLVMEPGRVYVVKKATGQIGIVWMDKNCSSSFPPQAPAAALESHDDSEDEFDIDDAPSSRPSSRSSMLSSSSSVLSSHSSHSSATSISSAPPSKTPLATKPTQPTKYLYQGGVSSVLTGGVMLGACSAPSSSQKHAAPAAAPAAVYTPPHRLRAPVRASETAGSWRRGASRV
ncbi:hypothetical protein LshimejAT787_1205440 [Lyophyllum shimeji]|uniref:Uncharacterized protein n=1 Tax=Lyophyllum shimeji TaxID=47721 RepID=A0A9P3PUD7_LYOSH|nr:hypothetical protein LshimejAT787_1205440 [Lyophyllum shimeji]